MATFPNQDSNPLVAMEQEKARLEAEYREKVAQVARDMAEYARIAAKYNLPGAATAESADPKQPPVQPQEPAMEPAQDPSGGTVASLIEQYQKHPESPYNKTVTYGTRMNYQNLLRRLERDHGSELLENITEETIRRWYDVWSQGGKHLSVGYTRIAMFKGAVTFGATVLKSPDCRRIRPFLHDMRFDVPKRQIEPVTKQHVIDFCAKAHEWKFPSMALAQKLQFYLGLKQGEVIGIWVPISEKTEPSDVINEDGSKKWIRGLRLDQPGINFDHPEIATEIAPILRTRPKNGPVVVNEMTGEPYTSIRYRRLWRLIANDAGIPPTVMNKNSSADADDEADDGGDHRREAR